MIAVRRSIAALALLAVLGSANPAGARVVPAPRLRPAARRALARLRTRTAGKLELSWSGAGKQLAMVRGLRLTVPGGTIESKARAFLRRVEPLIGVGPSALELAAVRETRQVRVLRFAVTHRGLPVVDATVTVAFDRTDRVRSMHANVGELKLRDIRPRLSRRKAVQRALQVVSGRAARSLGTATLASCETAVVVVPAGRGVLAYRVRLPLALDPVGREHLIDARTGGYIGARRRIHWEPVVPRTAGSQP